MQGSSHSNGCQVRTNYHRELSKRKQKPRQNERITGWTGTLALIRARFVARRVKRFVKAARSERLWKIVFQTDDIHIAVIVFVEFVASKNRHEFHELTRIKFSPSLRELKAA